MLTHPSLPERLKGGTPLLTAWCGLPDPSIAATLAREDFDAVVLDTQHGSIDLAASVQAIPLIAAAGKPAIVPAFPWGISPPRPAISTPALRASSPP